MKVQFDTNGDGIMMGRRLTLDSWNAHVLRATASVPGSTYRDIEMRLVKSEVKKLRDYLDKQLGKMKD